MSESSEKPKKCVVCGEGSYVAIPTSESTDLHNSGLGLQRVGGVRWEAVECDACGNVQVFRRIWER